MTRCLIVGGADCVFDDVEAALSLSEFEDVIVVKRMLPVWRGPVTAFASLHPDTVANAVRARDRAGLPMGFDIYTNKRPQGARALDIKVIPDLRGSSGLFAVAAALQYPRIDRIVLCGVPIDSRPHFDRSKNWDHFLHYRQGWTQNIGMLKQRVRSMSGWTSTLLGKPTEQWLSEASDQSGLAARAQGAT